VIIKSLLNMYFLRLGAHRRWASRIRVKFPRINVVLVLHQILQVSLTQPGLNKTSIGSPE